MIPLRTIEFEVNNAVSVIESFSVMARNKTKWGTILNWDFQFNSRIVGYINKTNLSFILNPVIDRLLGNRPSLVSITGHIETGTNTIKTKLILSFTGTLSFLGTFLFLAIIWLTPADESGSAIFTIIIVGITLHNFYLLTKDLKKTEEQLTQLVEIGEKAL